MLPNSENRTRAALRAGKKLSAAWLQGANNISAEIIASAGFDVIVVDMEHGPGDVLTLISQIQAMQGYPAIPFVRTPWNDFVAVKRILDAGAKGLFIPYINNRKEAEAAVAACLYPTKGVRGVAGSPRAVGYGINAKEHIKRADDDICIFLQMETPIALENLDDILSIERVDGIVIGPMDLACSMGHFADPAAEEVCRAMSVIEEKTLRAGKALATIAGSWEDAEAKYNRGYSLILSMSDTTTLGQVATSRVASFKKAFGG